MPLLRVGISPLLTQNVIDLLSKISIVNVIDFICSDLEKIIAKSGIPYKDLASIRKVLLAQYSPFPLNGIDLYEEHQVGCYVLSTTCECLDGFLHGGFQGGEVTEIVGKTATGKTQVCLSASVTVAKDMRENVVYIDTCGGFDIQRIQAMLDVHNLPEDAIISTFKRIRCCRIFDVFELLAELDFLHQTCSEQATPFYNHLRLVVVDNVASLISPILGGSSTAGHGYMMHVGQTLKTLATELGIVLLMTNNVTVDEQGHVQPSLGRSWRSIPHTRLLLSRPGPCAPPSWDGVTLATNTRDVTLLKSNRHVIGGGGVIDIRDRGITNPR